MHLAGDIAFLLEFFSLGWREEDEVVDMMKC
jgi:hypothetical protein